LVKIILIKNRQPVAQQSASNTQKDEYTCLFQDVGREETHDGQDGDDTHVTNLFLDRVFDTPQTDRHQAHEGYPVLFESEWLFDRFDGLDFDFTVTVWHLAGLVRPQEKHPNEYY
jgi:hypothetical protein